MIEIILINDIRIPLEKIRELDIPNHPMEAKMFMAFEVTKIFHGEEAADHARETSVSTFRKRQVP